MGGPIVNVVFNSNGNNFRIGAMAQDVDVGVGGQIAVWAKWDVAKTSVGFEGVVPQCEGR